MREGRVEEALGHVPEMNARHIASLILSDPLEQAPEKLDTFIRRLYGSLNSACARADAEEHLGGL